MGGSPLWCTDICSCLVATVVDIGACGGSVLYQDVPEYLSLASATSWTVLSRESTNGEHLYLMATLTRDLGGTRLPWVGGEAR